MLVFFSRMLLSEDILMYYIMKWTTPSSSLKKKRRKTKRIAHDCCQLIRFSHLHVVRTFNKVLLISMKQTWNIVYHMLEIRIPCSINSTESPVCTLFQHAIALDLIIQKWSLSLMCLKFSKNNPVANRQLLTDTHFMKPHFVPHC